MGREGLMHLEVARLMISTVRSRRSCIPLLVLSEFAVTHYCEGSLMPLLVNRLVRFVKLIYHLRR